MMNLKDKVKAAAAKHGYELADCDMRCGLFFLRKGTEVRSIGRYAVSRNATDDTVERAVSLTVRHGRRIDQIEGSKFFAKHA